MAVDFAVEVLPAGFFAAGAALGLAAGLGAVGQAHAVLGGQGEVQAGVHVEAIAVQ